MAHALYKNKWWAGFGLIPSLGDSLGRTHVNNIL